MGLVLDSSVLIAAERDAKPVSELLAILKREQGETEMVLSSITVIELEHGLYRANTAELARKRRNYLGHDFRGDPGRAFHQGNGPARGEDRRPGEAERVRHSFPGPADRRDCPSLRICGRHAQTSALPVDFG